jgi:hypothetical protein
MEVRRDAWSKGMFTSILPAFDAIVERVLEATINGHNSG